VIITAIHRFDEAGIAEVKLDTAAGLPSMNNSDRYGIDWPAEAAARLGTDFSQSVKLKAVAASLGITRSHLTAIFKEIYGETPHQWRLKLRLEHACELLSTRRSVTDISLTCGFNSSQHFATVFRKYFSMTPTAYRTRFGGPPDATDTSRFASGPPIATA
jgi:AraC-like DNA-binding protein